MQHGSLFSGGGGFDLAAQQAGWTNLFHCEKDTFCQKILKYYWPDAATFTDIKEFHGEQFTGKIDVLTGGFPCQPFSIAGKRRGSEDDRYLWPEMLRLIGTIRPRWVVGENVLGFANWNDGLVLKQVLLDLEAQGYKVWIYVLPAAGVNAPHQRYRVWIVAFNPANPLSAARKGRTGLLAKMCSDTDNNGQHRQHSFDEKHPMHREEHAQHDTQSVDQHHSDSSVSGLERSEKPDSIEAREKKTVQLVAGLYEECKWRSWPTQSPLCGGNDGLPDRLDGITFPQWRKKSLIVYGNAIVPQVALRIFKTIEEYETINV